MIVPFEIPTSETKDELSEILQIRLNALILFNKKFKDLVSPFPVEELISALSCKTMLSSTIIGKDSLYRINDFDLAEAFFAYTFCNESKCPDELILRFDSQSWLVAEGDEKVFELRRLFKSEGERLRHWNYSRIRAKLIFWELVSFISADEKHLLDLIEVCPEYMSSKYVKLKIHQAKFHLKQFKTDNGFLGNLSKAIRGDLRSKKRIYNYWQIDYFHRELSEGIKIYRKLKDKKLKKDFLKMLSNYWDLSDSIQGRIMIDPRKDSIHCIDALVEKGLIPDRNTYTHTIKPYLNGIRENILYLENCQARLWQSMDFLYNNSGYFDSIYIWNDIKMYDFEDLKSFQPEVRSFHLGF